MDSIFEFASTATVEDGESQRDSQFVFVTDHDRHYIRSYLMRTSWTKRSRKKPRKPPEKRNILLAKSPEVPREEASNSTNRQPSIEERLAFRDQEAADPAVLASLHSKTSLLASSIENRKKVQCIQRPSDDPHYVGSVSLNSFKEETLGNNDESAELLELDSNQDAAAKDSSHNESYEQYMKYCQSPKSRDIISPWEVANFDPFQTCPVTVRPSEHSLIYHLTDVFGTMMFGKPRSGINPMAEVCIPESLTNEASFYGMLSYAATHLAHLRDRESGIRGKIYQNKAIASIQKLLDDDRTTLSDSTVGAILMQISIEDRFGRPQLANLHRVGLERIIEKRGGSVHENWRLELLLYWYLITSKPTFQIRSQAEKEVSVDLAGNNVGKEAITLRYPSQLPGFSTKLFDFFHELRLLTPSTTQEARGQGIRLYPIENETGPTNRLLHIFKNPPGPSRGPTYERIQETCRLAALFYMSAIKADSLRFGTSDFEAMIKTVSETYSAWEYSLEMLLWVLLRGKCNGLEHPEKVQLVVSFMEVAKLLRKESENVVKDMLIGFLCDDPQKAIGIYEDSVLFVTDLMEMQS